MNSTERQRKQTTQGINKMIDINDLTLKQVKQIQSLCDSSVQQLQNLHPFVGAYVIARCYAAGVHAGTVVGVDGENVILSDSVRLWSWKAQDGIALSGVANHGIKKDSKLDTKNKLIYLTGVCELIPCTTKAKESINAF